MAIGVRLVAGARHFFRKTGADALKIIGMGGNGTQFTW